MLVGYPSWYEGPKDGTKDRKSSRVAADVSTNLQQLSPESPLDEIQDGGSKPQFNDGLIQALAQEIMRFMTGKGGVGQQSDTVNSFAHFVGKTPVSISSHSSVCNAVLSNALGSWITDTGASDHMTHDPTLFTSTKILTTPIHVTLPDGTLKTVTEVGQIPLNKHIILHEVLFVPEFKFHLLSVHKLLQDYPLCAIFFPDKCCFSGHYH